MSNWYWRVIALKAAFVLTCLVSYLRADDTIQKLPFCNPHTADDASATDDLVIVSTLDGRLTAFTASNGIKAWDVQTQPLLSSNLHHVELTAGGKWVRLVPSLRGTLYSLSGETVEPLPFDAEQLLSSSFKYSEDLVIAGARETVWLGLDARTGAVAYECSSAGCSGDQDGGGKALLVLRRHSSTVRALDPRNGNEKWNFSVGEHQLALNARGGCGAGAGPAPPDYHVALALPEGVLAVRQPDSQLVLWKQKLEAPVAGMWRLRAGALQSIDVLWAATRSLSSESYVQTVPPSLYIGSHHSQLYIQEGPLYVQNMDTSVSAKPVPWKLRHVRPLIAGPHTEMTTALQNSDPDTLSLITLYGNTRDENRGYFLYQEETCDQAVQVTEDLIEDPTTLPPQDDHSDHHHIHVHVYSLWFWWKEVLLIAISSALLMNLMIWPRFFASKPSLLPVTPVRHYTNVYQVHYDQPALVTQPEYSGRYENDFTPLRCLGRGGFGVVFEARNNIDHCSYAVKRITLPRRESKRERVLREVRALAKLDHEHIVRYFNAWLEEPPADWQQRRDAHWMRELDGVSVNMTEEGTSPLSSLVSPPPLSAAEKVDPYTVNPMPQLQPGLLDLEKELGPKRLRSLSCNDSLSIVFDSQASQNSDTKTKSSLKNSLDLTSDLSIPPNLSLTKNLASGDNDDSFIVFERSEDLNHNSKGLSEARNDSSHVKQLERVEEETKMSSVLGKKNKKGHTRHWSLDMCVKSDSAGSRSPPSKMYLYIQMQLCRRDSLHDWLRNNRTYEARGDMVKTLFSQIVSAVEYVHLAGLIHRDLKPSNIFFAPDGKVKVGDFGLVTAMSESSQDGEDPPQELEPHTRHTYRVGTHLYMSPEQLSGGRYGYKVDIYSLGLVLLELLQPFGTEAERVECLLRARRHHYPPAFRRQYPNELEMLKRMLCEDPRARPSATGVRAGAPLYEETDNRWHYCLPNSATA